MDIDQTQIEQEEESKTEQIVETRESQLSVKTAVNEVTDDEKDTKVIEILN